MTPWLALFLLSGASFGQEKTPTGSLERARRTFVAADADGDHSLIFGELEKAGLSRRSFKKFDADGSDSWSEADFFLYYENLLQRGKRTVEPAFSQEIARIKQRRDPAQRSAPVTPKVAAKPQQETLNGQGKAILAVPEQSEPIEKSAARAAKRRPGEPAPAVVLDPSTVPTPKNGAPPTDSEFGADQKAPQERESAKREALEMPKRAPRNLHERAKQAQRARDLAKPKPHTKRTPG